MRNRKYRFTIEIDDADGSLETIEQARKFADTIGAGAAAQWYAQFTPGVDVVSVEPVEAELESSSEGRRRLLGEEALTQIRLIADDGSRYGDDVVAHEEIEASGLRAIRVLTSRLRRICGIAEGGELDASWRAQVEECRGGALTEVHTVEVEGRDDGLYLFADAGDRNAFATAVESDGTPTVRGAAPLHDEAATKALIKAEVRSTPKFEIVAVVRVEATDEQAAYKVAKEIAALAGESDGRVHLELLEGAKETGPR